MKIAMRRVEHLCLLCLLSFLLLSTACMLWSAVHHAHGDSMTEFRALPPHDHPSAPSKTLLVTSAASSAEAAEALRLVTWLNDTACRMPLTVLCTPKTLPQLVSGMEHRHSACVTLLAVESSTAAADVLSWSAFRYFQRTVLFLPASSFVRGVDDVVQRIQNVAPLALSSLCDRAIRHLPQEEQDAAAADPSSAAAVQAQGQEAAAAQLPALLVTNDVRTQSGHALACARDLAAAQSIARSLRHVSRAQLPTAPKVTQRLVSPTLSEFSVAVGFHHTAAPSEPIEFGGDGGGGITAPAHISKLMCDLDERGHSGHVQVHTSVLGTRDRVFSARAASHCPLAYVAMLTDAAYFPGVLALFDSLRRTGSLDPDTRAPHQDGDCIHALLLISDELEERHTLALHVLSHFDFVLVQWVSPILYHVQGGHTRAWYSNWTVLRVWSLERYTRVLYLDLDTLALKNLSHLLRDPWHSFGEPTALQPPPRNLPALAGSKLAAALNYRTLSAQWESDTVNGGVLLLEPDAPLFALLCERRFESESPTGGVQPFLNEWLGGSVYLLDKLSYNVNAHSYEAHADMWSDAEQYLVHYTGAKPWAKRPEFIAQKTSASTRALSSHTGRTDSRDPWLAWFEMEPEPLMLSKRCFAPVERE
eukprot:TRINITY_DN1404_c0_g1_i1.p1 TRINITY_DN1404_c0_g1~~TRINITY_DN1404_c0_g1_i1.p1  ORF type:complete len:646 (-),score=227.08 TRINITY_DN1404_c0_g1_i1:274-2211(-)